MGASPPLQGVRAMYQRVQVLVNELIDQFHAGEFDQVVDHYDFPVQLTLEARSMMLMRPRDLTALLREQANSQDTESLVRTRGSIAAIELPRKRRFRAWVTYNHLDSQGREVAQSNRIIHLRDRGSRLVIEAVEVSRLPVASLRRWKPSRRLSA